jgi:hypothetical protein
MHAFDAADARSQITNELNQTLRRLRQYRSESDWAAALLDGAGCIVEQAALFVVEGDALRLRGDRNLSLPADLSFPVASARAFANAISTIDTIVTLRATAEVGAELSADSNVARAHIIPITNGQRVAAVLFAAGEDADVNALELLVGMASLVLERQSNAGLAVQIAPAAKQTAPPNGAPVPMASRQDALPAWSSLGDEQRNLHIRAQRFARVKTAEMELSRPEACHAGREQSNVYLFLKKEIDVARESYRNQFLTIPSMVDYLHLELVRAAEGDEAKLGADYPGRLA